MKTTKNIMACMVLLLLFFSLFYACAVKVPVVQQPEKPESAISVKLKDSVYEKPLISKAEQLGIKGKQSLLTGDIRAAFYFYNQALAKADEKERAELMKEINSFIVKTDTSILEDLLTSESNLIPEPVILYRLGLNYASHGSYSKAEKVLVLLIDKYPDHVDSKNAMEIVQLFKEHAFKRNKIGCLLPLSGKFSVFGQKALKGVELAVSDLSREYSQGIKVFIKDTQSDNKMAVKGMEELLIQKVVAIAGPMITAGAACTIAEENEIPIIAMTQKEEVALKGKYIFSNFLTPEMQARALVSYAFKNLGVTRFAMLYPRDRYGRKYMNLFWDMVDEIGGEIVGVESYSHDQTDFSDAIKKITGAYYPLPDFLIKDKNPLSSELAATYDSSQSSADVIFKGDEVFPSETDGKKIKDEEESLIDFKAVFIPDAPSKITLILPQLAYNDATGLYLLGTNIWHNASLIRDAAGYVKNSVITEGYFANSRDVKSAEFAEEFKALYGEEPGFIEACAYDTITMLIKTAMDSSVDSRKSLKDSLYNRIFDGVTGKSMFDHNGNSQKELFFLTVKKGKFVEISH